MKAGHGLNSTRLTAGAFANAFRSDALLSRPGHRHAGAGGGSLGRKRRVPALPFEGAPLLHLDPPYLEVPVEADPNETLFRLGVSMVEAMARGVPIEPLARYFEYWLLRLQGVYGEGARMSSGARAF